jgi:hypothetical protein
LSPEGILKVVRYRAAEEAVMKFSEVVARVIDLATTINNYWETELPKQHPKYPLVDPNVPDPPPPPQEEELRQFLLSRPADEVYKLRALADVGSGVPATEFEKRWRRFMKDRPDARWEIEHLVRYPPLADGLIDGLAEMSVQNIDVDAGRPAIV